MPEHHPSLLQASSCRRVPNSLDFRHRTNVDEDCLPQGWKKAVRQGNVDDIRYESGVYRPALPSQFKNLVKGDSYVLEFSSL